MLKRFLLLSAVVFVLVCYGVGTRCFAEGADVSAQFVQAETYISDSNYTAAEVIYKAIVQDYPGTDEAFTSQQKLIILYMAWDKQAKAEAAYEQLVSEFGGREDLAGILVGEIAGAFREAKQYESAKKVYEYVVSRWPTNELAVDSQTGIVKCYLGLRDDANSASALTELFSRFSGHKKMRSVVHDLAFEYRSMRKWAESRELFRYFLKHWPDDEGTMKAQRLVVKASIRLGDDPNADAAIEELIKLFGDKPEIRREMSEIANDWAESGRYEKAVPQYKYVVEHWPGDERAAWTQMALAMMTAAAGDEAGVTAALDKLGSDFGADAAIVKLVGPFGGFCRHLLQVPDKQSKAVGTVISERLLRDFADRDAVKVVDHIGDFYRDTKAYKKAVEAYEYVANNWPESERAIESKTSAVKVYISIGDEPNASAAFEKLIGKFAGDKRIGWAAWQVGEAYWDEGSVEKAYDKYKYVVEHWPKDERAIWAKMGMVRCRIRQQDLETAEAELGDMLVKFANDKQLPAVVHEIVEEYRNVGAYQKGRGLFAYLLENWDPDSGTALELQVGIALQSIKLGELDKANAAVAKLIADYNDNPNLGKGLFQIGEEHYGQAFLCKSEGLDAKSEECFRKALSIWQQVTSREATSSRRAEAHFLSGVCYSQLGEYEKATEFYQDFVNNWPEHKLASYAKFMIEHRVKEFEGEIVEGLNKQETK